MPAGRTTGDLRFSYDRDDARRTTAEGHLKGEDLDLAWLLRRPVKIDRVDLVAGDNALRIRQAAMNWADQRATLSGAISRGAGGLVINARLDS